LICKMYAFESISYWDKDKKQPRSKRKYLGKVDPETGEIIPSRGRSTHIADACQGKEAELKSLYNEIKEREAIIDGLRREVDEWKAKYGELVSIVQKIRIMTESI